jgi:hypothetical protein
MGQSPFLLNPSRRENGSLPRNVCSPGSNQAYALLGLQFSKKKSFCALFMVGAMELLDSELPFRLVSARFSAGFSKPISFSGFTPGVFQQSVFTNRDL